MDSAPTIDRLEGDTSQNCESTRLWHAIGDEPYKCYIDIGAGHPTNLNVGKLFYDRGWFGVSVEPGPYGDLYDEARPNDVIVRDVISDHFGMVEWSTSPVHPDLSGVGPGYEQKCSITLAMLRHDYYSAQCATFVKVDVEGHELEVLQGADWDGWLPEVWCIEAIDAATLQPNHHQWEPILLDHGYEFAYFDGINRFYNVKHRPDIGERLRVNLPTMKEYPA